MGQGGAHQIQAAGDPGTAQPHGGSKAGLGITRSEQQGTDHLGPDDALGPPLQCGLQAIGDRVSFPQVHPGATRKCLPDKAFRLAQLSKVHGNNLRHLGLR